MNIEEIEKRLAEQRILIEKIYDSVEKTRKYFMWSLIITVFFLVVPLVIAVIAVPFLLTSISSLTSGFGSI